MKKLLAVQKQLESISADSKNPHFKSAYASLEAVLLELKKVLNANGVIITQLVDDNMLLSKAIDADTGTTLLESKFPIIAKDMTDPQKFGGGVTYARRYSLLSMFAIPVDDDDGNSANRNRANPTAPGPALKSNEVKDDPTPQSPPPAWLSWTLPEWVCQKANFMDGTTYQQAIMENPKAMIDYAEWELKQIAAGKRKPQYKAQDTERMTTVKEMAQEVFNKRQGS